MASAHVIFGDSLTVTRTLPDASVDLLVTSPPFLSLRSYLPPDHPDKHLEIGSEATPADFLDTLLALTQEWRRVLAPHGSICVELGDTYSGSGGGGGDYKPGNLRGGQNRPAGPAAAQRAEWTKYYRGSEPPKRRDLSAGWPLPKSLCGIPTLYSWSLAYGRNLLRPEHTIEPWRVRNIITWLRPNPPVGALGDKWRPASSFITVATPGRDRYFDLDAVRGDPAAVKNPRFFTSNGPKTKNADPSKVMTASYTRRVPSHPAGPPPLDWWDDTGVTTGDPTTGYGSIILATAPYGGAHYATYPAGLPKALIECMCPRRVCATCGKPSERIVSEPEYERTDTDRVPARLAMNGGERVGDGVNQFVQANGANTSVIRKVETLGWTDCGHDTWRNGVVFDPFAGSGTTLAVATGLGRDAIGIELDPRNLPLIEERVGGLFLQVAHLSTPTRKENTPT